MHKHVELVVVIPIGPNCQLPFIEDTINSIIHYTSASCKIVLADDSQKGTGKLIKSRFPETDLFQTSIQMGKLGGLYITLSLAFRYIMSRYHFDALLRIDTDGLLIGPAPEKEAIQLFKSDAAIGIAGQYPSAYNGKPWDISWPRTQVLKYTGTLKFFKHPAAHFILRQHYKRALKNGYRAGESVFGGACFYSERLLRKLLVEGLLPHYRLQRVKLEEDHLFSLLAKSAGFRFGDLSSGAGAFACAWKGLPASPEQLYEDGRKIIHSTRYWNDRREAEIRHYFSAKRTSGTVTRSVSVTRF